MTLRDKVEGIITDTISSGRDQRVAATAILALPEARITDLRQAHDWVGAAQKRIEEQEAQLKKVKALVAALTSIANNTCCDGCGEAARVARAALAAMERKP
jgi:hypothetical protein